MSKDRSHLRVVPPPPPEKPVQALRRRLKRQPKPAHVMSCPRCSGRASIVETIGAERRDGKSRGGTKVDICSQCNREGERVEMM